MFRCLLDMRCHILFFTCSLNDAQLMHNRSNVAGCRDGHLDLNRF